MNVLLTIWISAVLIQEVVPSTLVRYPRQASNASSFLHTEYEAKIEQTGKHGNESFGKMSGKQAIEHDNCNDNWNAFANKCAALIKDLVASLANTVSSKPGDATNLQLHIKNTFRHLDNTHNCSCLNHTGKELSDMDLSHLFDNLTLSTTGPNDDNDRGPSDDEEHSQTPVVVSRPKNLTSDSNVNPENEEDPNSTSNSRRQAKHEPYNSGTDKQNDIASSPLPQNLQGQKGTFHPFLTTRLPTTESSDTTSEAISTIPPLHYTHKQSPIKSSSSKKFDGYGYPSAPGTSRQSDSNPTSVAPLENEPVKKTEDTIIPPTTQTQEPIHQNPEKTLEGNSTPKVKTTGSELEKPDHNYEGPNSDPSEHEISTKPKDDDNTHESDPQSNESLDYDSPTEAPTLAPVETSTDKKPFIVPVTNTDSNIPESSEPTTGYDSLSSGTSPRSPDENSHTEDVVTVPIRSISDKEHTTTPSHDETSGAETVTVPSIPFKESPSTDEIVDEAPITPKVVESQIPDVENQSVAPQTSENSENGDTETTNKENSINEGATPMLSKDEDCSTTPQTVYPTDEQAVTEAPEKVAVPQISEKPQIHSPTEESVITPDESSNNEQNTYTTTTQSSSLPVEEEGNEGHTEVSENPALVQPTTFQTTSEDPTRPPPSTQASLQLVPITTMSTPQDSEEGTTAESKHEKHHDDDDDEDDDDDCCSCESCTEEEESNPKKMKENVCKSLEEARKELKAIFDKIKKKLRCCRKIPPTITSNSSPLPQ